MAFTDTSQWVDEDEQNEAPEDDYMNQFGGMGEDGGFGGIDFSKLGGGNLDGALGGEEPRDARETEQGLADLRDEVGMAADRLQQHMEHDAGPVHVLQRLDEQHRRGVIRLDAQPGRTSGHRQARRGQPIVGAAQVAEHDPHSLGGRVRSLREVPKVWPESTEVVQVRDVVPHD